MVKKYYLKLNHHIFSFIVFFLASTAVVNAARVGHLTLQPWANIAHNNPIHVGPQNDRRNNNVISFQIPTPNNSKALIYSIQNQRGNLDAEFVNVLDRVFRINNNGNANEIGSGLAFQAANHTKVSLFASQQIPRGGPLNDLYNNENISVKNAYSNIVFSHHGKFSIEPPNNQGAANMTDLYHTEPKALNDILSQIYNLNVQGFWISDVILISKEPMCGCCSRLLLNVINNLRNQNFVGNNRVFPNVIVISKSQFLYYPNRQNALAQIRGSNLDAQTQETLLRLMGGLRGNLPNGNQLALLIHYS